MDAKIAITAFAREGEGKSNFELLAKSVEDTASVDISIESGNEKSSVRFAFNSDGKPELILDPKILKAISESIVVEVARLVIGAGVAEIKGNDCSIKVDSVLSLLSQQNMKISARDLEIGSRALKLTSRNYAKFDMLDLIIKASSNILIECTPGIHLKGRVSIGSGDMRPAARVGDTVQVGNATGQITSGGTTLIS